MRSRGSILACLLALSPALAWGDGFPIPPPLPLPPPPVEVYDYPRHIYRDGNYFFCPYADYDPYCRLPSDPSWALYGPPWSRRPPIISVPVPNSLLIEREPHVPFAAYAHPPEPVPVAPVVPPIVRPPPEPPDTMEADRERIIRQGEAHCRKYPQDTQVCHPAK